MRNNKITPKRYKIKYFLIVPRTRKREHKTPARETESKSISSKKHIISLHPNKTPPKGTAIGRTI
jgi:hypothetical protein